MSSVDWRHVWASKEEVDRHPFLHLTIITSALVLVVVGAMLLAEQLVGQPVNLGLEIDWEKVLPVIIKFAAETLVAAYSVFRLLKPIEARLAVVEAKLDLMGTSTELRRILTETE